MPVQAKLWLGKRGTWVGLCVLHGICLSAYVCLSDEPSISQLQVDTESTGWEDGGPLHLLLGVPTPLLSSQLPSPSLSNGLSVLISSPGTRLPGHPKLSGGPRLPWTKLSWSRPVELAIQTRDPLALLLWTLRCSF